MIKGIQAFEACWKNLRASHPTGPAQNLMIAQAMGQVTDHYGTAEEIERTLPTDLQALFRTLIHAYFNGYAVKSPPAAKSSSGRFAKQGLPVQSSQKSQLSGRGSKPAASRRSSKADQPSQARLSSCHNGWGKPRNEAETLIIEFPFSD
ncbi:MAG: hypothetical protein QNJ46_28445 [Leptolyngbyaceae cyanobacterium MO_188.B28]|nr:hypothetical protein [Leptolyngbyaceae cyanobacterium MO_188.B28]